MKRFWSVLSGIILALYPLLVYMGLTTFNTRVVAAGILIFVVLRMVILSDFKLKNIKPFLPLFTAGVLLSGYSAFFNSQTALLLMPVFTSVVFLITFGVTLFKKPSMVERFAALKEKNMTDHIKRYCFKVTIVWIAFFILNGIVACYTVFFTSKEYWTLYNGLISYVIMGTIFAIEFTVRKIVVHKKAKEAV